MKILQKLSLSKIEGHFESRMDTRKKALLLRERGQVDEFVNLVLGISDPSGNYSAATHGIGKLVLSENMLAAKQVANLARLLEACAKGHKAPEIIWAAAIKYIKISVGSEIGMMMNPGKIWVTNEKSVWATLLLKHRGEVELANEELALYRGDDVNSEMAYEKWASLHRDEVGKGMELLLERSREAIPNLPAAEGAGFLLADAIAYKLFERCAA